MSEGLTIVMYFLIFQKPIEVYLWVRWHCWKEQGHLFIAVKGEEKNKPLLFSHLICPRQNAAQKTTSNIHCQNDQMLILDSDLWDFF